MDFQQLIDAIDPDTCEKLRLAVETGKWANGTLLTEEQREHCLQAVIAYDQKHKPEEERVGFIPARQHTRCGGESEEVDPEAPQPVKMPL